MKTIKIQNLAMINFKGIRDFEINFVNDETFVYADNGVGKTTIFDAFNWLLFGKDSLGRSDFEIKTLDAAGSIIPKIEHEVSATLLNDGTVLRLRRILKENWVKKRGSAVAEFSGNITEYYWNDVPVQQKEYQANISQLLDEQIFKLITSTSAFNALDWKLRRSILSSMVVITEEEIIGQNLAFQKLMQDIKGHKSIEDYKKMKNASIKKAKEDLANIPTRIDEVTRNKPDPKDFVTLKVSLASKEKELADIDAQIEDKSKQVNTIVEKQNAHTLKVNGIKTKISKLETDIKNEADKQVNESSAGINKITSDINGYNMSLAAENTEHTSLQSKKLSIEKEIESIEKQMAEKREEWAKENAKTFVFDETECKCPTCKRAFDADDIDAKKEELLKNFNTEKDKNLRKISEQGQSLKKEKEQLDTKLKANSEAISVTANRIQDLNANISTLKSKLESLKPDPAAAEKKLEMIYETMLSNNVELIELNKELVELNKLTFEPASAVDNTELKEQKAAVNKEISAIKDELAVEETIKSAEDRIKQLTDEESILAQQIADVENEIMVADQYTKAKIDALESKINEKFLYVKFKMFDQQINGGETECCEATVKGVPFSDANTAAKINAGIDIINTLTEFYNVNAPIFIDNRESIINILPTHSQVVNLVVSAVDKKLRVA